MSDQELFNAFKESSETDRDFDFKSSGWYKVNRLLNHDDHKKRKKWLLFLPWVLACSMLGFCVFLFQNQSNSNCRISGLIAQMNKTKTVVVDTVIRIKYIYIHDTVLSRKTIYVESFSKKQNSAESNIFSSYIKSFKEQFRKTDKTLTNMSGANLPDENGQANPITPIQTLAENTNDESGTQFKTSKLLDETTHVDSIKNAEFKYQTGADDKNDSLQHKDTTSDSDIVELADKKNQKNDKPKFDMVSELGVYGGVLFPMQKNVSYQFGYNVGMGYNLLLSPNFLLQLKGAYSQLRFETNQINSTIGVPFKQSPNPGAGYIFESATSSLSSLNVELGFAYVLPLKYSFKPFIGFAYGGRYSLPSKANYTFYNNINEDVIVETENKSRFFVWNNVIPSVGLRKTFNDRWSWYLNGFYNYAGSNIIAVPNYFGVNTSFYYKF